MPKEPAETHRTIDLEVRADLADAKDAPKRPEAAAYVFSQGGKLLTVADLDAEGAARVSLPVAGESTQVRVFVGPRLEKGARATLSELRRRGARERHVRLGRDQRLEPLEFRILPDTWHCWLLGLCVVRGTLVKRVTTDGYPVEFPVCDATVEIYEVDPFHIFISKLPKVELDRLRDYILHPRPLPEPPPEELPGPFPGPFPGPAPIPDRVPPSFRRAGLRATAEHSHRDAAFALADSAGASDLRLAARGGNRQVFEQALVAKADVVRPLLCVLFPKLVWMQKIGTATTDECGHFEELLFLGCHGGDKPDLYFKAKQKFLGIFDITIYAPKPVSCYTHWNYKCGTEVKLVTYHPLASTCAPCQGVNAEGNWVLFAAVGNVSLARIYGASDDLQATVHVDNNPTYAEIDAPTIGLASADPCCGVLEFTPGDMVTIPWRAKHKNGFATYGFQVKRVAELVFSTGGPVGLVGNHSTVQSAATLLNTNLPLGCAPDGCDVAGFASWLDVQRARHRRVVKALGLRPRGLRSLRAVQRSNGSSVTKRQPKAFEGVQAPGGTRPAATRSAHSTAETAVKA